MQRLELLTRLTHLRLEEKDVEEDLTPEEAVELAYVKDVPTYVAEYPVGTLGTLSAGGYALTYAMGTPRRNYVHVFGKPTNVEFLQTYVNVFNLSLVPVATAVLATSGVTDYKVDPYALSDALIELLTDQTGPIGTIVVESAAQSAGILKGSPESIRGPRLKMNELTLLAFLGQSDGLIRDDEDGSIRWQGKMEQDMGWEATGSALTGTLLHSGLKTFILPEYVAFRTLREIGSPGPLSFPVIDFIGALLSWSPEKIKTMKLGPAAVEITREEKGEIHARLRALLDVVGAQSTFYYSGKQNKEWSVENRAKLAKESKNKAERLSKDIWAEK